MQVLYVHCRGGHGRTGQEGVKREFGGSSGFIIPRLKFLGFLGIRDVQGSEVYRLLVRVSIASKGFEGTGACNAFTVQHQGQQVLCLM